jgi:glycosyltransferase involved in cell wall biosynthesis
VVSVAIATFNRKAMVEEAIVAALAQECEPLEVCVSDDASADGTWEMLEAMAASEPRLRIFRRSANSGGVENWNFVVDQTRGAYIAWCSDDDRFLPGHLAASVAYLEANPAVGMTHCGFIDRVQTPLGERWTERPLRFSSDVVFYPSDLAAYLLRYYDWPFHPSTIVMRRRVWEETGLFNPSFALADTDWFVRVAERFPVAMLARYGVLNRRHPGNWSNRLGSARMQNEIRRIVEASIGRVYAHAPAERAVWTALWRANVRLRLALTLAARLRMRQAGAAQALWRELSRGAPAAVERWGGRAIARWCAGGPTEVLDPRQRVTPL